MPADNNIIWDRLAELERNGGTESVESLLAKGWFTLQAYCEKRCLGDTAARRRLNALVDGQRLDTKLVNVKHNGAVRPTRVYKLKENPCLPEK